ncbi:MAG: hypothetical protein C0594_14365 [Marinilabiliales bacterium]|nr:MAG: hypothetical protein C0594_14365 [Marinilabiliales bacterium]
MRIFIPLLWFIVAILGITGFVVMLFIIFNPGFQYVDSAYTINNDIASSFGSYFGGFIGTIFAFISTLLIVITLLKQNLENRKKQTESNFFKMLDYHNENVKQLDVYHIIEGKEGGKGKRAFIIFKMQIRELIKILNEINTNFNFNLSKIEIADIAYISFYYGIDDEWSVFSIEKLNQYERKEEIFTAIKEKVEINDKKIGRTNQTSVSSYYRNLYNAVKLIDEDKSFTKREKKKYIKILRAQLSNPELYVFFFNILSRFGTKWRDKDYITKYGLLTNIPLGYTEDYNPKDFFQIKYEEDEL